MADPQGMVLSAVVFPESPSYTTTVDDYGYLSKIRGNLGLFMKHTQRDTLPLADLSAVYALEFINLECVVSNVR